MERISKEIIESIVEPGMALNERVDGFVVSKERGGQDER